MKSKTQLFIFALILSASIQVSVGEAEAEANPEANADAEPVPEAAPEGRPKLVVPGSDDELIIDEDAIILVNPIQKNTENRAPRQYRGQLATQQQRSASGASQTAKDLVSDIHCLRTPKLETLTAFLHMPEGFSTAPVLESSTAADSNLCLITRTNAEEIYALDLSRMEDCGVRECQEQGEVWMCITIRFPILTGLKMPEDEVIDIKCKPQDPAIAGNNIINFQENVVEQRSPAIYIGGGQEFLSEIGLFRKLPGTELFASRVKSGSTIELGENVQLRSIVRSGDGWNFAKITDVVVHRVHDGKALTSPKDTAELVFSDGCRNPAYRALAVTNPWRDSANGLINNFDFRVFMFQDMDSGDSIMISAKVVACVDEIDCAPIRCGEDTDPGFGRRKRSVNNNGTADDQQSNLSKTKGWEENLELKIRMPADLLFDKEASADAVRFGGLGSGLGGPRTLDESECKIYLIVTLSVALTFCVLSAAVVLVACIKRYQENRATAEKKRKSRGPEESSDDNLSVKIAQFTSGDGEGGFVKETNDPYFYVRKSGEFPGAHHSTGTRPVTVRSVKRRDKAKTEEKNNRLSNNKVPSTSGSWAQRQIPSSSIQQNGKSTNNQVEERAIMV